MSTREEFWHEYFKGLHGRADLDDARRVGMSNNRVINQEYSLLLESAGDIFGGRCLDVGCGLGQLARALQAFGGQATGIDYVQATIEKLQREHPGIAWWHEDVSAPSERLRGAMFNLICACEVLQHVDPSAVLPGLWALLQPGGRLIGLVPNAGCAIVQKVQRNYPGSYSGLTVAKLREIASRLPGRPRVLVRGLTFQADQSLAPYAVSAWDESGSAAWAAEPNRLQFVFLKEGVPAGPAGGVA